MAWVGDFDSPTLFIYLSREERCFVNNAVYNISLDLHAVGSQLTLTAKAYDTARTIRCTLTENGKPYTISEGCYAAFTAKKPDGNVLFNATTIDDAINYEFTVNTVNAPGEVECEIRLYDGNGKLITSPRFSILVDDTVYHDGDVIESASEYTALTRLMEMVVSTLGEIPSPVLYGMAQNLSGEQKAQARENIGAVSAEDLEAKQTFLPVTKRTGNDGDNYTATDEDSGTVLPVVSVANSVDHISAEGKGRQIVFIPYETNMTNSPTLQINGGQVIPIRMRAPKNQGSDESSPDATLPVPGGALMRGVPYTMTFCGKYWLVDSQITQFDQYNAAMLDAYASALIGLTNGDTVAVPIINSTDGVSGDMATMFVTRSAEENKNPSVNGNVTVPTAAKVSEMIAAAIGDTAGALAAMDNVIGGAEA